MADETKTDPKAEALKDGGFASRKLALVMWTQALIFASAAAAGKWNALVPMLGTIVGGLIGAAALYITGNVAAKHVIGKQFEVSASKPADDATDEK